MNWDRRCTGGAMLCVLLPSWKRHAGLTDRGLSPSPALHAGGEIFTGAIRSVSLSRIIRHIYWPVSAPTGIIIPMIQATVARLLVCCIWAGYGSDIPLVRMRNWVCVGARPVIPGPFLRYGTMLTPQFAVEGPRDRPVLCALVGDCACA